MSAIDQSIKTSLQGKLFNLALIELVCNYRESFQPLWSQESWAKFLILLALKCDLSGERESLELFAESLGAKVTSQMRRIFFERRLEKIELRLIADPSDKKVLVMPLKTEAAMSQETVSEALQTVGLSNKTVSDPAQWSRHDALIAIPWKESN